MLPHVTYISSTSRVCILIPRFFLPNSAIVKNAKIKVIHDEKNPAVN